MKSLNFIGLAVLLLSACQTTVKHEATPSDYIVRKGETFSVDLKSNPTTGYRWILTNRASASAVDSLSDTYIPDKKDKNIVGSGGTQSFKFNAVQKGIDSLNFIYVRSWEVGAVPCDKASFIVEVR